MVISRNRLAPLLCRIAFFVGSLLLFIPYFQSQMPAWRALCFFDIQADFFFLVLLGIEIIANAIDMRHGIYGIPAGVYMPFSLCVSAYAMASSILHFAYSVPLGAASLNPLSIAFHLAFLLFPLLDWVLFDEKGTVHFYSGFAGTIYPIFYVIFSWVRVIIWPNNPIYGDSGNYVYDFINVSDPFFWAWALISFVVFYSFLCVLIWINNALAGKYSKVTVSY